jgi:hypothetical protein
MYYKINPTGCGEKKGLVEIRFDCFFEEHEPEYAKHYFTFPVWPESGYPGKVDEVGDPIDNNNYIKWRESLPTESHENPFVCHFRCFEPDITDEDILKAAEEILTMSYKNYKDGDLGKNKNEPIEFSTSIVKIQASLSRAESVKAADYAAVALAIKSEELM